MKHYVVLTTMLLLSVGVAKAQDLETNPPIGGEPSVAILDSLSKAGFKTIISVMDPEELDWDEGAVVDSLGMTYRVIPMSKPVDAITDAQLAQFDSLMSVSENVFLHCGSGNRAAALWATWMIEYEDADVDETLARAESAGLQPEMRALVVQRLEAEN